MNRTVQTDYPTPYHEPNFSTAREFGQRQPGSSSRLAGYEDVNDAERLCVDSATRHVLGDRASQPEKQAASTSEFGRFETETARCRQEIHRR